MSESRSDNTLVLVTILLSLGGLGVAMAMLWPSTPVKVKPPVVVEHLSGTGGSPLRGLKHLGEVPEFALTEIDGRAISKKTLLGKVWVVDFIFTRCGGTCPEMTEMMGILQERTKDLNDLQLVSVSVDPKFDTVEALTEYATEHGADRSKWWFLKGEKEALVNLAHYGLKLGSAENPMNHSPKFVLIDAKGAIRGYYEGAGPYRAGNVEELEADLRSLLKQGGS
jgi:protein SCO1/2